MSKLVRLGMFNQNPLKKMDIPYAYEHIFRAVNGSPGEGRIAVQKIVSKGLKPILTLEPWEMANASEMEQDLAAWADQLAVLDTPIMIRFAHEMNGTWYPWCIDPTRYKAMWKMASRVLNAGMGNQALMVWCPNINYETGRDLVDFWPGKDSVDYIGVDMYCQKPDVAGAESFAAMLERAYHSLDDCDPKLPRIVVETGCGAGLGQADWVKGMFRDAIRFRNLEAVCWFNASKPGEPDYRVARNVQTLYEFQQGSKHWAEQRQAALYGWGVR